MKRLLDIAQLCFYVAGIIAMLWAANTLSSNLIRVNREMDVNAIRQEQMLKDHVQAMQGFEKSRQEHERLMQGR
jgi:hypothetical protein